MVMKEITQRAMNGDLDFKIALCERVKLLAGLSVLKLEELYERIPITPGAEDIVRILQYLGYRIGIVSGGFQFFIDRIKSNYKLDYGVSNQLEIIDGKLTGRVVGDIIDSRAKERALISIAKKEGFKMPTNKENVRTKFLGTAAPTLLKLKVKEENNAR